MGDGEFETRGEHIKSKRLRFPFVNSQLTIYIFVSTIEMANWNRIHSGLHRILFEHEFFCNSSAQIWTNRNVNIGINRCWNIGTHSEFDFENSCWFLIFPFHFPFTDSSCKFGCIARFATFCTRHWHRHLRRCSSTDVGIDRRHQIYEHRWGCFSYEWLLIRCNLCNSTNQVSD